MKFLRILCVFSFIFVPQTLSQFQSTAKIEALDVQCGDNDMMVSIEFNQPFKGVIFSKGYFSHHECVYVRAGESNTKYQFAIPYEGCGSVAGGNGLTHSPSRPSSFLRKLEPEDSNEEREKREALDADIDTFDPAYAEERSLGFPFGGDQFGMGGNFGNMGFGNNFGQNAGYSNQAVPKSGLTNQQSQQTEIITGTQQNPEGTRKGTKFFENIIIVQFDSNIQEVWDVAKALRCEWHENYHKTVTYRPFAVDMLEVVEATFAGDNVGVWMTVQQGKGPFAPEVNGIVRIGETLTLAIGIQDPSRQFDMRVLNCFASDGFKPSIQLVDEYGCVTRPKIMSGFEKTRNFGQQASVVSHATFQAFKFPDSVDVHLECGVEICKYGCPQQCFIEDSERSLSARTGKSDTKDVDTSNIENLNAEASEPVPMKSSISVSLRRKRSAEEAGEVGVTKTIKVVAANDMAPFFDALQGSLNKTETISGHDSDIRSIKTSSYCMSAPAFTAGVIILVALLIVTALISIFLCMRLRTIKEVSNSRKRFDLEQKQHATYHR